VDPADTWQDTSGGGGHFKSTASINGLTEAVVIMQPPWLIDDLMEAIKVELRWSIGGQPGLEQWRRSGGVPASN